MAEREFRPRPLSYATIILRGLPGPSHRIASRAQSANPDKKPRTVLRTTCAFRLSAKLQGFYWTFHFIFVTLTKGRNSLRNRAPRFARLALSAFPRSYRFYWLFHFIFVTLQSGLQANGQTHFASDIFYHHFFPGVYFLLLDKDNLSDF